MASLNKVQLIGNLGRDPELRSFPDGGAICNVTIATTRKWKDRDSGDVQEETEWHRVVFRERLAEIAGEYLKKGGSIYVEGRLKTRKWTDKDGVEKYTTEVIADELQMLGSKPAKDDGAGEAGQQAASTTPAKAAKSAGKSKSKAKTAAGDVEDDIPF